MININCMCTFFKSQSVWLLAGAYTALSNMQLSGWGRCAPINARRRTRVFWLNTDHVPTASSSAQIFVCRKTRRNCSGSNVRLYIKGEHRTPLSAAHICRDHVLDVEPTWGTINDPRPLALRTKIACASKVHFMAHPNPGNSFRLLETPLGALKWV